MQMRRDFTKPKMRGWVFVFTGAEHTLVKSAYTGVAAALIGGKTTHSIAGISSCFNSQSKMSRATKAKLQSFWKSKMYLIIDEYSMLSKTFLAAISNNISIGKQGSETSFPDWTFGGINVVLCGVLRLCGPSGPFLTIFRLFFNLCYDLGSLSLTSPLCATSRGCASPFWTCT
jgi:PIF1-like helicase